MRRMSLTSRLSWLFMLAVSAVLLVAGLSFYHLSQAHFKAIDQHTLNEKLQATEVILQQLPAPAQFEQARPALRNLLGAHRDLSALITDSQGQVLLAEPASLSLNPAQLGGEDGHIWQWQEQQRMFRGLSKNLSLPGQQSAVRVLLVLDVSPHMAFFNLLQQWFWLGLLISALLSAGLGWLVASNGLRPLRQVTRLATAISAQSLTQRIALAPIPHELQQLVSSFNAMLARLEDAFVRLSNFSADIAHELRTPLSTLITHTEVVLARPRALGEYEETLYANLEDLQLMSRMIDDMLFLAKADNGLMVPAQQPVALQRMARKLLDYYQILADESGIQLTLEGAATVPGDEPMLHRAVANLLSNALRYTPAGNRIQLRIRESGAVTLLQVSNPGEPIAAQHLERLFDRFYRVDPARREGNSSNAGLGLAIARSIVLAHRGRIYCSSAGAETLFTIELPSQLASAEQCP
jgi:two-component system, OmpR family, heavy metal sensor histidine kinase CusS